MEGDKDMFKDAVFGDRYETRCGLCAVYVGSYYSRGGTFHKLYVQDVGLMSYGDGDCGMCSTPFYDIVDRWSDMEADVTLRGNEVARLITVLRSASSYISRLKGWFKTGSEKADRLVKDLRECRDMLRL